MRRNKYRTENLDMKKITSLILTLLILTLTLSGCFSFGLGGGDAGKCKVNFYVEDVLYKSTEVSVGSTVSMPRDPELSNMVFVGWFTDGLLSHRFDFSERLLADINLYAHFTLDAEAITDMVQQTSAHSLVTIYSKYYNTAMGGFIETESNTSQGSGVIINIASGWCYVLTNCHVVEPMEGFTNQKITVEDVWGDQHEAQIYKNPKKTDSAISEAYDLALICFKYTPSTEKELVEVEYSAKDPEIGDAVISLGAPAGQKNSLTCGEIVSYRRIEVSDGGVLDFDVIVHGASINHGSSGGPLLNSQGRLIGLNYAGFEDGEFGCAIPISKILEFMNTYAY